MDQKQNTASATAKVKVTATLIQKRADGSVISETPMEGEFDLPKSMLPPTPEGVKK